MKASYYQPNSQNLAVLMRPVVLGFLAAIGLSFSAAAESTRLVTGTSVDNCQIDYDYEVKTTECSGKLLHGLCRGEFYRDIVFAQEFSAPPHIIISPSRVPLEFGCQEKRSDIVLCYPGSISTKGFRLWCSGSPPKGFCGNLHQLRSKAEASWLAFERHPRCLTDSGHGVVPANCTVAPVAGTCSDGPSGIVAFTERFAVPPKVFSVLERAGVPHEGDSTADSATESNTATSIDGADTYLNLVGKVTEKQFELIAGFSPIENGWLLPASVGWLALEEHQACQIESGKNLLASQCPEGGKAIICRTEPELTVKFDSPFSEPPIVLLSVSSQSSLAEACNHGAHYGIQCYLTNTTAQSFSARCSSAHGYDTCGLQGEQGYIPLTFSFLAIAKTCAKQRQE